MVILLTFMFVVATLAAILDLQTPFAIETSPFLLFGGQNMHASKDKSLFLYESHNEAMAISEFAMPLVVILADILDFHTAYTIETIP